MTVYYFLLNSNNVYLSLDLIDNINLFRCTIIFFFVQSYLYLGREGYRLIGTRERERSFTASFI